MKDQSPDGCEEPCSGKRKLPVILGSKQGNSYTPQGGIKLTDPSQHILATVCVSHGALLGILSFHQQSPGSSSTERNQGVLVSGSVLRTVLLDGPPAKKGSWRPREVKCPERRGPSWRENP